MSPGGPDRCWKHLIGPDHQNPCKKGTQMATQSLDVVSTSMLAGLDTTADAPHAPFASPLSITGIAMTAAGVLAGGVAVSVMAISAVR